MPCHNNGQIIISTLPFPFQSNIPWIFMVLSHHLLYLSLAWLSKSLASLSLLSTRLCPSIGPSIGTLVSLLLKLNWLKGFKWPFVENESKTGHWSIFVCLSLMSFQLWWNEDFTLGLSRRLIFFCRFHHFRFHFVVQIQEVIPPTKMEAVNRFHIPTLHIDEHTYSWIMSVPKCWKIQTFF